MLVLLLALPAGVLPQSNAMVLSGQVLSIHPVGTFDKRLLPAVGFSISGREAGYNNPRWGGFIEYALFDRENRDDLFIKRKDTVNGTVRDLTFPLKSFDMTLEYFAIGVTGNYNLLSTDAVDLNATVGFGIYQWNFKRQAYFDSVTVDTGSTTQKLKLIEYLQVPSLSQRDWSGGFDLGVDLELISFSPVILSAGVKYKIILGELWPTLKLDLENVSGIQSVQISMGLKYLFE